MTLEDFCRERSIYYFNDFYGIDVGQCKSSGRYCEINCEGFVIINGEWGICTYPRGVFWFPVSDETVFFLLAEIHR